MNAATVRLAQEEARSLVQLVETDERKAMVVIVLAADDDLWADRAASAHTNLRQAEQLLHGLDLIRERIATMIEDARQ